MKYSVNVERIIKICNYLCCLNYSINIMFLIVERKTIHIVQHGEFLSESARESNGRNGTVF